jgi:hypothetical protein
MSLHPAALVVAIVIAIALLTLPRSKLVTPFFLVAVFLPLNQGFDFAGLDITLARFLIFTAWLRFFVRGEVVLDRWRPLDTAMCLWCGIGAVAYVLLWGPPAFIGAMGQVVNYAGTYFLVRLCVTRLSDVVRVKKAMMFAAAVLAVFVAVEASTGRNVFAIFGGVPEITEIRDGHLRCQGPFGHPISAGLFGASLVPIFFGSIMARRQRALHALAVASGVVVVVLSASSGPFLALGGAVVACCCWPLRRSMRTVCWGLVGVLGTLHIVMKAPVWALIARASVFDSSSSWHRLNLLDQFIWRFGEWWLVGTQSTDHWGFYAGDVANNYVRIGVSGGVFTLLAYFLVLRRGFTSIGAAMRASKSFEEQTLLWGLGGALMAHVVGSFGLSYWDQTTVLFALLLGLISAATSAVAAGRSQAAPPKGAESSENGVAASRWQIRDERIDPR